MIGSFEYELYLLVNDKCKIRNKYSEGYRINEDLRELLLDFYKEAEKLKVQHGQS